jgi:hypothetical protein
MLAADCAASQCIYRSQLHFSALALAVADVPASILQLRARTAAATDDYEEASRILDRACRPDRGFEPPIGD